MEEIQDTASSYYNRRLTISLEVPQAENRRLSARNLMPLRLSGSVERWAVLARRLQILQSSNSCHYLRSSKSSAFRCTTLDIRRSAHQVSMYFVVVQILTAYFDAGVQVGQGIPHIVKFAHLDACSLTASCQPFALLGPVEAHSVLPLVRLS